MIILKFILFFIYNTEITKELGVLGFSFYKKRTYLRYFLLFSYTHDLYKGILYFRINLLFLEFMFNIRIR